MADGSVRELPTWWIAYRVGGKLVRQSTETTVKTEADRMLRAKIVAIDGGRLTAETHATTLNDLASIVETDYRNNGRRSSRDVRRAFDRLTDHFGKGRKAQTIRPADVEQYKAKRMDAGGATPATINRELAMLRRGFRLAVRLERLGSRPDFSLLAENNARRGFFERDAFDAVLTHLAEHLRPLVMFLYWTGWRRSEATKLEWRHVNRRARVIRIEDTKNRRPRTIPYGELPALAEVIEGQWKTSRALREKEGVITPWVFHRRGKRIDWFVKAWRTACEKAGVPGRLVHDLRRTAARNMLRAGIPQNVAMEIGGWKTDSVFRRYAIVDETLLAENLKKLAANQASLQ